MESRGRSNSVELRRSSNADHVTLMPVVSADGSAWTPIAILPGKRSKWRKLPDGSIETPAHFLPHNSKLGYRDPAGKNSELFQSWAAHFVDETTVLGQKYRYIVLKMDGYGAHVT